MSTSAVARPKLQRLESAAIWLGLVVGGALMVFPIYWMFATAVRPRSEVFGEAPRLVPSAFIWSNFAEAWQRLPFLQWTINSLIIAAEAAALRHRAHGRHLTQFQSPARLSYLGHLRSRRRVARLGGQGVARRPQH